jgi:hypothetical protein
MDNKPILRKETLIFTGRNVFVLYLVLAGQFLDPLFPCHSKRLLENSMLLRHLLGFLTLLFFVVIIDEFTDAITSAPVILGLCAAIYVWFVLSSKMTSFTWIALMLTLSTLYLIDLFVSRIDKPSDETKLWTSRANTVLITIAIGLTIVGFTAYMGEKKLDYGKSFSYLTFILGKETCRDTVSSIPFFKAIRAAFT